jgi:serine/threonine protein kinase
VGTVGFVPPEVVRGEKGYDAKAWDVYSIGVCLTFMALRRYPVASGGLSLEEKAEESAPVSKETSPVGSRGGGSGSVSDPEAALDGLQPDLRALVASCWREDPILRPTAQELLARLKAGLHGGVKGPTEGG